MSHIQRNHFFECQQTVLGLGENLERLDVVIRGLQRNNKDKVVLKDKNAMSLP